MTRAAALICAAALLAGCAAPTYHREADYSASLPRAIGLGAFAGQCIFLCFVSARFGLKEQGLPEREDATMKGHEETTIKTTPELKRHAR